MAKKIDKDLKFEESTANIAQQTVQDEIPKGPPRAALVPAPTDGTEPSAEAQSFEDILAIEREGRLDEALGQYDRWLLRHGDDPSALVKIGNILLKKSKPAAAMVSAVPVVLLSLMVMDLSSSYITVPSSTLRAPLTVRLASGRVIIGSDVPASSKLKLKKVVMALVMNMALFVM